MSSKRAGETIARLRLQLQKEQEKRGPSFLKAKYVGTIDIETKRLIDEYICRQTRLGEPAAQIIAECQSLVHASVQVSAGKVESDALTFVLKLTPETLRPLFVRLLEACIRLHTEAKEVETLKDFLAARFEQLKDKWKVTHEELKQLRARIKESCDVLPGRYCTRRCEMRLRSRCESLTHR